MESTDTSYEGAILALCSPLLDISADVPVEFLEKYGVSLNNAILAEEKHMPIYADLVNNFDVQNIAGGSALNTVRVAQWMLQKPDSTAFIGAVGTDENGNILEQRATDGGVKMILQKNAHAPTGTCAVLIHDGERSLVANLGAANTFTPAHLETPDAQQAIQKAKVFYTSGFFLTVSTDSIIQICNSVVENNAIYALNLSAEFVVRFYGTQLTSVLPFADFVFANESEAAAYGEVNALGTDLAAIALSIAALPKTTARARVVVFTQGSAATLVASEGVVTPYPVQALPQEQIVDTNGAGDAFVGGFLSQLVQGRGLDVCVQAGHYAAGVVIQQSGCTFPTVCHF